MKFLKSVEKYNKDNKIIKVLLGLFILLSIFTHTLKPINSGIINRIILADIFGIVAIILFFFTHQKLKFNRPAKGNIIFLLFLIPGLFVSVVPLKTLTEIIGHAYLFLLGLIIYNSFRSKEGLIHLIILFAIAGFLASVFGIWDAIASFTFLPRFFPARGAGEVLSGFRSSGQAGTYILMVLAILIPFKYSLLFNNLSRGLKYFIYVTIILSIIFLLLTAKLATYIGLFFGLILFIIMRKNFKILIPISLLIVIIVVSIPQLEKITPAIYNRIEHRIYHRIAHNNAEEFLAPNSFMVNNFKDAITSFKNNPLVGTGIGGFSEVYQINNHKLEVHGTYLKILGETGILGTFGYTVFVITFLGLFFRKSAISTNPYKNYLSNMLPFIIGCFISWGYTYHMRKREFYVLMAIVGITNYLIVQYKDERLN